MIPRHFGLIGHPVSHSYSERYFNERFMREGVQADYRLFDLHDLSALPELIELYQLQGFNVTIPYKTAIIPYLNELDPEAKKVGAVNCVTINDGKLKGYNSDIQGFRESLLQLIPAGFSFKALILGTGGASKAVQLVLKQLDISFQRVSRFSTNGCLTYDSLTPAIIKEHRLIIQTTPLGMSPLQNSLPELPYEGISDGHYVMDLIYNPEQTKFLQQCALQGATTQNGLPMLYRQADLSYVLFLSS